jgi:hypothetical protein
MPADSMAMAAKRVPKKVIRVDPDGATTVTEDGVTTAVPDFTEDTPSSALERRPVTRTSAAAAASMRIAGASYAEIAAALEYASAAHARAVVEKTLAGAYQVEDRETLFRVTAARLDGLTKAIYPKAVNDTVPATDDTGRLLTDAAGAPIPQRNSEQIAYGKLLLDVLARQAKLHGLDAPTQVLINPQAEEFNKVVSLLARQVEDDTIEADVFDAEIVEDGEL